MTKLGQFNTAYLGETGQVSTVTALGQSISGAAGLTSYGYLPNSGDRRLNTITFNADAASNETITTDDAYRIDSRTDGTGKVESYSYDNADRLTVGTVTAPSAYTETYGLNNADFLTSKSGEPVTGNNWSATNTGLVNRIGTLTPSGGTGRTYSYDADGNVLAPAHERQAQIDVKTSATTLPRPRKPECLKRDLLPSPPSPHRFTRLTNATLGHIRQRTARHPAAIISARHHPSAEKPLVIYAIPALIRVILSTIAIFAADLTWLERLASRLLPRAAAAMS